MQSEHEITTSDQKLKLWLAVLCQVICFGACLAIVLFVTFMIQAVW
jgi:hypothetical protein